VLGSDVLAGSLFFLLAVCLGMGTYLARTSLSADLQLAIYIVALVLTWCAGFALSFGRQALKAAHFPLLFLLLMVPLPNFVLHWVIYLLQAGSANVIGFIFDLLNVPALRQGFVFRLPQVSIEVAQECSGIRSSIALLILTLPIMHFRLRSYWRKIIFLTSALMVMILKNGIRVATLTLLAVHVDPSFLFGRLHKEGGALFFLIGLFLLLPIYLLLQDRRSEALKDGAIVFANPAQKERSSRLVQ
jgi:exosortase